MYGIYLLCYTSSNCNFSNGVVDDIIRIIACINLLSISIIVVVVVIIPEDVNPEMMFHFCRIVATIIYTTCMQQSQRTERV